MITGFIIGILAYSLFLTVFCCYKDCSSYFSLSMADIIIAGPFAWLLVLILWIFGFFFSKHPKQQKTKTKTYSQKSIEKTVKKIIKNYTSHEIRLAKRKGKNFSNMEKEIFRLSSCHSYDEWRDYGIRGWDDLLIKKARYEWLNKVFCRMMWNQKEETEMVLKNYFQQLTKEEMDGIGLPSWLYSPKDTELFVVKNCFLEMVK